MHFDLQYVTPEIHPYTPRVIQYKVIPNRVNVSYAATRFHESAHDETPESPEKSLPVPVPKETFLRILHFIAYQRSFTNQSRGKCLYNSHCSRTTRARTNRSRKKGAPQEGVTTQTTH